MAQWSARCALLLVANLSDRKQGPDLADNEMLRRLHPDWLRGVGQHFAVWLMLVAAGLWANHDESLGSLRVALGMAIIASLAAALISGVRGGARWVALTGYWVVSLPVLVVVGAHGLYVGTRGALGREQMRAIAQTHAGEAFGFLNEMASWSGAFALVACIAALGLTFPAEHPTTRVVRRRWPTALLAALLAVVLVYSGTIDYVQPLLTYAKEYQVEAAKFRSLLERRKVSPIRGAVSEFSGTTVLVIGESTARRHMGLYGYWRDTTPRLDARAPEMVAFRDVVSPHSHTVPALMSAMTSSGSADEADFFDAASIDIVSLARAAGIETYWISNQNEFGVWDYPVSMIGKSADHSRFFSTTLGKSFTRTEPDGNMLPSIRELLARPSGGGRLIMIHLFSTHWPYCSNHPRDFTVFTERLDADFFGNAARQGLLNCYDNGVAYVDWFLSAVISAAADAPTPTSVLYFSDHGEAPMLGTGHEAARHSIYHVEIPFIFWANESFRRVRSGLVSAARGNAGRSYSTADLYHSLADLIGVDHESVKRTRSAFNAGLESRNRVLMDGRIRYDEWSRGNDYRENARVTMNRAGPSSAKVWSHRTNSIGALLEAKEVFAGIEMDVVFEADCNCFRVYHAPAPDTGLTLERMLEASKRHPGLRLWLDWKNASPENVGPALQALDSLDKKFGIRARALVETGSKATFPGVAAVSDAGFNHGYYLPTEPIVAALQRHDDARLAQIAAEVEQAVEGGRFSAITFDWRIERFVREQLGKLVARRGLALYSWDMGIDPSRGDAALSQIERHFETLDLSGLLVTFPSIFKI